MKFYANYVATVPVYWFAALTSVAAWDHAVSAVALCGSLAGFFVALSLVLRFHATHRIVKRVGEQAMTDAESPKPGDVVAVPLLITGEAEYDLTDDDGYFLHPGGGGLHMWQGGIGNGDGEYVVIEKDRVAPWRSAEEVRAADAVIEAARRILNEIDSQRPDVLHNGAIQSVRDDAVLAPMLAAARDTFAAYDRSRKEAAQ